MTWVATALRTPQAEWVQGSTDHVEPDGWIRPQTAHSYEGLLCLIDGENWKILDAIAWRLRDRTGLLSPGPVTVSATPLEVVRRHELDGGSVQVRFRVVPNAGESGTVLEARCEAEAPDGVWLDVRPVFDMRHMYGESDPAGYLADPLPGEGLSLMHGPTVLVAPPAKAIFHTGPREVPLTHEMGSGFRERTASGTRFTSESRTGWAPGTWSVSLAAGTPAIFRFAVAPDRNAALKLLTEAVRYGENQHRAQAKRLEWVRKWAGDREGLAERCYVMAHGFGMPTVGGLLPEAAGWWFRTPWFRDVFEGLLGNWRTLLAMDQGERISAALMAAARLQDPVSGRIPNRLPERREDLTIFERTGRLPDSYYHSADATLLFFTLLDEMGDDLGDPEVRAIAPRVFERAVAAFRSARLDQVDGPPVLMPDGLLACVPWHTWTDGKRSVDHPGGTLSDLPLRVPVEWHRDALEHGDPEAVWRENHRPHYLLPEINAQWLRMLIWGATNLAPGHDLHAWSRQTLERARTSWRTRFVDPATGRIANLVTIEGRTDWTAGSPALVALALLIPLDVVSRRERARAWEAVRDRLLAYQGGRPFGVLVKDSDERIYLGDAQYHEAVCWPRDTRYLISLWSDLGQLPEVSMLLETTLQHQLREGVLFYNHELFSLPDGLGARRGSDPADCLIPVKNPMQWWSQWCDPFFHWPDRAASGSER